MKRLIIGCGYLGRRVAELWNNRGDAVWALTRHSDTAREFETAGINPLVGDVLDPTSLSELPAVDTVLYAVGFDRSAGPTKRQVYVDGLRHVLAALPKECGRLLYVSSTSVYGQSDGQWVDEASPSEPASEGGRICRDAEEVARASFKGPQGMSVVRLSGIYGPGRLAARVDALHQQRPITANPDGWLNLIHVDDARDAIMTAADFEEPLPTLLVSDDRPLLRRDYYAHLTAAIGAPSPVFEQTSGSQDRGKRCSNALLHESLGLRLSYPSIVEGLPTALDGVR